MTSTPRRGSIGYVTWGDAPQLIAFDDFRDLIDERIYLRTITADALARHTAVVVPDFTCTAQLYEHRAVFNDYLRGGGFLIVFGANKVQRWIDAVDIRWFDRPTVDWKWWMKRGGRLEIYQPEPRHPLAAAIPVADMSWHFFGAFRFAADQQPIVNLDHDEGCIMFDQRLAGGGRLIATTLDPHTHHGRRFMPATTRFLKRFYPWLRQQVDGPRQAGAGA